MPLRAGFRGRLAEDTAIGVDEGQVLTLLVGERGVVGDTRQTIAGIWLGPIARRTRSPQCVSCRSSGE